MVDVYLYGMVLKTNSFLMDSFPKPDHYQEFNENYQLPGGETGTCATVLASLGCKIKMDGNYLGKNTYPLLKQFYSERNVDISSMHYDENYAGLEDYVLISDDVRTPLGMFGKFYSDPVKHWNVPKKEDILSAKVAGIDPYFSEEAILAAKICVENNIPFATIDCAYDSYLNKYAAVNVISGEYFQYSGLGGLDEEEIFEKYTENTDGLVIFTHGSRPLWYGRRGEERKELPAFKVDVVSTLGAGDTFKAGTVYGLLHGFEDKKLVRFASACSAVACTSFPLPLNPPTLEKVMALL